MTTCKATEYVELSSFLIRFAFKDVASQDRPLASFAAEISKDPDTNLGSVLKLPNENPAVLLFSFRNLCILPLQAIGFVMAKIRLCFQPMAV